MHSWSQVQQAPLLASQQQYYLNPVHHREHRDKSKIQSLDEQNLIKITKILKDLP